MSKNLDESIASVTTPSFAPSIANSTVHAHSWMRCSAVPRATDLGNYVLHHLLTSTKRVPAPSLYRRLVTVICRRSDGARIWFASCGIDATAAVLTTAFHTRYRIQCCSVLLSTVSSTLASCLSSVSSSQVSSVSIPIVPSRQDQRLALQPKTSSHHLVDLSFTHYHLLLRVPQILTVPLKILPCRFRLLVPSPEGGLPSLRNHLVNLLWVGYQCPDFFIRFLFVSHILQDSHLRSVFILDPF